MPCFEIVDSRIQDWKIKIQDTVADNASCGVFVLGDRAVDPRELDLSTCGMVLEKNGEIAATGAGAAALGSPVNCVAWLANTLGGLGIPLEGRRSDPVRLAGAAGAGQGRRQLRVDHRRHRRLLGALRTDQDDRNDHMSKKIKCAMIGPGNIGTDLLFKLQRSAVLEPVWMVGIDPASDGLQARPRDGPEDHRRGRRRPAAARARRTASRSPSTPPRAYVHAENCRKLNALGVLMIDLTPAAIGPYCVPPVNLEEHVGKREMNVNMVTCGGQATIPMVAAVSRVQPVAYGEIVATVSSQLGRPRHAQEHRRVHPHHRRRGREGRRREAGQGHHHHQPGRAAADHARHHPLPDRGRAGPGRDHRVDPRDDRGSAEVRAGLPAGERPGVRRQARVGLHGGRGPGRLPAQVRRQPRHHDRRRAAHRRDVRRRNPERPLHRRATVAA